MQITEIWRTIAGWEGLYEVSNLGRIKSLQKKKHTPQGQTFDSKPKILKPSKINSGYLIVGLTHEGYKETKCVHVLVAEAFVDNPNNYGFVNHEDGNKENNKASNLAWCTRSMNMIHAIKTGLFVPNWSKGPEYIGDWVVQLDKQGNEINRFPSGMDAARATGFTQSGISHCIHGRMKTYKGFVWKYT